MVGGLKKAGIGGGFEISSEGFFAELMWFWGPCFYHAILPYPLLLKYWFLRQLCTMIQLCHFISLIKSCERQMKLRIAKNNIYINNYKRQYHANN